MTAEQKPELQYDLRLRLYRGERCFGPGVAQLMHGVEQYGSIRAACRDMGMAYSKAWKILNRAEQDLNIRLIARESGGKNGGTAVLTPEGKAFLRRYDEFVQQVKQTADLLFSQLLQETEHEQQTIADLGTGAD